MSSYAPHSVSDSTTQAYVEIYDITNDIVILRDGSASMILGVNSLNFGLLSEEEQDAIIYSYAGLLNSLAFPIQIVIRSQRKDITKYLNYLRDIETKNSVPMRRAQIAQYREFVEGLVKERNILDKKFYVVIPYPETSMETKSVVPSVKKKKPPVIDRAFVLEKALTALEPRRDHLISQFARIGLQAWQLSTQEIIQTFYQVYNPGASDGQEMTDTRSYTTAMVQAQFDQQGKSAKGPIMPLPKGGGEILSTAVEPLLEHQQTQAQMLEEQATVLAPSGVAVAVEEVAGVEGVGQMMDAAGQQVDEQHMGVQMMGDANGMQVPEMGAIPAQLPDTFSEDTSGLVDAQTQTMAIPQTPTPQV